MYIQEDHVCIQIHTYPLSEIRSRPQWLLLFPKIYYASILRRESKSMRRVELIETCGRAWARDDVSLIYVAPRDMEPSFRCAVCKRNEMKLFLQGRLELKYMNYDSDCALGWKVFIQIYIYACVRMKFWSFLASTVDGMLM